MRSFFSFEAEQELEKKRDREIRYSSTVIVRHVPADSNEELLKAILTPYHPSGVRLLHDRATGEPLGWGYILFPSVETANHFLDATRGTLLFQRRHLALEFAPDDSVPEIAADWFCPCGNQCLVQQRLCPACARSKPLNADILVDSANSLARFYSCLLPILLPWIFWILEYSSCPLVLFLSFQLL